ncbi:hypothetical protein EYF80_061782 [Liparis tanakae]|uniref:Uncharacterized protein n=1 Tax=Liparis tanakae TaxID=230148 RepID=A0A4Z2EHB8_9TELE|nr:hypothetical protein EYF80_061782 [Liparis tanakae]
MEAVVQTLCCVPVPPPGGSVACTSRRGRSCADMFFWTESGLRGRHRGNNPSDGENRMGGSSGTKGSYERVGAFGVGVAASDRRTESAR